MRLPATSPWRRWFSQVPREMVEFGETDPLFLKPQKQATEDYITGRFG